MPVMYAVGKAKAFRTLAEGKKAGFYPSFNALAQAKRVEKYGEPVAPEPAPVAVAAEKDPPVTETVPSTPKRRRRVQEQVNAESGSDQSGVLGTADQRADG